MGAFRSKPILDKFSKNEENDKLRCAVSTMQGWRVTQEDAYNFILNYDTDTAFFGVYDGHGGHEVAEYLSRNLPQFLKDMETYKNGDIEKTLIDGFLKMDESLNTDEIMSILKEIAMEGVDDDVDENIHTLKEEASMPVEKVIEKYRDGIGEVDCKKVEDGPSGSNVDSCSSSRTCSRSERKKQTESSSSTNSEESKQEESSSSSQTEKHNDNLTCTNNVENSVEVKEKIENSLSHPEETMCNNLEGSDNKSNPEENKKEQENSENNSESKIVQNGDTCTEETEICAESKKEEIVLSKGKGKAVIKRIKPITITKKTPDKNRSDEEIYKSFLKKYVDSEEESEDYETSSESSANAEDDLIDSDSPDEIEEAVDDESEDDEIDDEENEDDENDDDDDDDDNILLNRDYELETPGIKSGSTGVVALLKGNQLYVSNVGDSRCVVCREGKAVRMSFDHKPTNKEELERVTKAGGTVEDDRVDGGLNMSRAFGDFYYKSNKELSQLEQLIIALPDVKTLTIDPHKDEFMILASDGIWNVKNCQKVIDFLRPKIATCKGNLSDVIEELFDDCLATCSFGAGTDNMTLILVQFKANMAKRSSSPPPEPTAKKLKSDSPSENMPDDSSVNCS